MSALITMEDALGTVPIQTEVFFAPVTRDIS